MATIRRATLSDAAGINEIGNHYILHSPVNFKVEELSLDERQEWIRSFGESGRYQLFVAQEKSAILGFTGSALFHERCAYETSIQTTIYMHPDERTRGLGTLLYKHLFKALTEEDIHRAYDF